MAPQWRRTGFLLDALFKGGVALTYAGLAVPIGEALLVPAGVVRATAVPVLLSGVAEGVFAIRSAAATHTRYLVAYDGGWVLVTGLCAALLAGGATVAGPIWFGYQAIASLAVAVAFAAGTRAPVRSG